MSCSLNKIGLFIFIIGILGCYTHKTFLSDTLNKDYFLVDIQENLYCSKYEVTNLEYRSFLKHLKITDQLEYQKCKIDSLAWNKKEGVLESFAMAYSWHPAYDNYPVVNVPIYGAKKYCAWLANNIVEPSVVFKLPTESEFTKLLIGAQVDLLSDSPDDYTCPNFNLSFETNPGIDGASITVPSKNIKTGPKNAFVQNSEGAMHIIGNVAEYLEDGRAIGGSWNSFPSEVKNVINNVSSNPEIGFRVWIIKQN